MLRNIRRLFTTRGSVDLSHTARSFLSQLDTNGLCTASSNSRKESKQLGLLSPSARGGQQQQRDVKSSAQHQQRDLVVDRTGGACDVCGKRFFSADVLAQHTLTRHHRLVDGSTTPVNSSSSTAAASSSVTRIVEKWNSVVLRRYPRHHQLSAAPISSSSTTAEPQPEKQAQQQQQDEKQEEGKAEVKQEEEQVTAAPVTPPPAAEAEPAAASSAVADAPADATADSIDLQRAKLLAAELQAVEAAIDALVAWSKRDDQRRRAKQYSLIRPPVLTASSSSSSSSSTSAFAPALPGMSPFASSPRQPFGMWDPVSVMTKHSHFNNNVNNSSGAPPPARLRKNPSTLCDVGGVASVSLVAVVVAVKIGFITKLVPQQQQQQQKAIDENSDNKSDGKSNPDHREPATILQVACRNYQCDGGSGRVSMLKHNVTVRVRSALPSQLAPLNRGDVVFVRGQLQLHTIYNMASRRWNCNGLVIDVAPGVGEVSIVAREQEPLAATTTRVVEQTVTEAHIADDSASEEAESPRRKSSRQEEEVIIDL